ncbi:MAG: glycosyltransferase family 4 protein [Armatimonadetes bacterium]|nr:glycosyltransferase family 4 protein [Armatimonadota bacterium]
MKKPVVLVLCPHYLPGYRSGGPVRSVSTLIERLSDQFDFRVITHCHDYGLAQDYENVPVRQWTRVGAAQVLYLRDWDFAPWRLRRYIRQVSADAVYLNSFFHRQTTIPFLFLRRYGLVPKTPTVIAPRGEFSSGALKLRGLRKRLFLGVVRFIGLYENLVWQASSEYERDDIRGCLRKNVRTVIVHVAPDLSMIQSNAGTSDARASKNPGELRVVYLGRISAMKNVDYALKLLRDIQGRVVFDLYGPFEDPSYTAACRTLASELPENCQVTFHGPIPHEEALAAFASHHVFLFPTRGENFGHVILESFAAGCPVLLSDQTPWRNLAELGVGWDLPLAEPSKFEAALQSLMDMDREQWNKLSSSALAYAAKVTTDEKPLEASRKMLLDLCSPETHPEGP